MSDLTTTGRTPKVLGLAALVDLVTGLVLAALGLVRDRQPPSIVGLVLLAYVSAMRNKPEAL